MSNQKFNTNVNFVTICGSKYKLISQETVAINYKVNKNVISCIKHDSNDIRIYRMLIFEKEMSLTEIDNIKSIIIYNKIDKLIYDFTNDVNHDFVKFKNTICYYGFTCFMPYKHSSLYVKIIDSLEEYLLSKI
jgi:hypothetical protein